MSRLVCPLIFILRPQALAATSGHIFYESSPVELKPLDLLTTGSRVKAHTPWTSRPTVIDYSLLAPFRDHVLSYLYRGHHAMALAFEAAAVDAGSESTAEVAAVLRGIAAYLFAHAAAVRVVMMGT